MYSPGRGSSLPSDRNLGDDDIHAASKSIHVHTHLYTSMISMYTLYAHESYTTAMLVG